jgi:catechol 2,3-dioxygenase-like lactoylglutathione lyase family enzyme
MPDSPTWLARLDHVRLDSDDPARLAAFYRDALGMRPSPLEDGTTLLAGPQRRIVIGKGEPGAQPFIAYRVAGEAQLGRVRRELERKEQPILPSPSAVFAPGAVAVKDPDGRLVVFGLPRPGLTEGGAEDLAASRLPGRLQHVVVASATLAPMLRFYEEVLGWTVSDYVMEGEGAARTPTVGFFRSDPEHHSFAVFRCPETRPDHHSYEAGDWNAIRDWADHMASLGIKLWWGPGRHGPGNNLFFMIQDPQGYLVELSAEIEIVPDEVSKRTWKHEERTLNLWGSAFMRS